MGISRSLYKIFVKVFARFRGRSGNGRSSEKDLCRRCSVTPGTCSNTLSRYRIYRFAIVALVTIVCNSSWISTIDCSTRPAVRNSLKVITSKISFTLRSKAIDTHPRVKKVQFSSVEILAFSWKWKRCNNLTSGRY